MINKTFIVGSSIYTMSIQMLVAKSVLQDPDQYARILPNNVNRAKNLKQNPTVKGMKRFLTETIISDSRGSTPSKFKPSQLLAELESDEEEGPNTSKQRSPTLSSDDDILDKVGIGKKKVIYCSP
jgi:predicted exporter